MGQKDSPLESNLCSASLKGMSERLTTKLAAGETSEVSVAAEGVTEGPCRMRRCFALRKRERRYCCGLRRYPGGRSRRSLESRLSFRAWMVLSLASWAAQRVWEPAATDCSAEETMGASASRLWWWYSFSTLRNWMDVLCNICDQDAWRWSTSTWSGGAGTCGVDLMERPFGMMLSLRQPVCLSVCPPRYSGSTRN